MDKSQLNQIRAQVKIPQQLAPAAKKIVEAGRKVMFSKESRKIVMDALSKSGSVEERLGGAISDLMMLMWYKSNQSMPLQLVAPCATLLGLDAIEFMIDAGEEFDVGNAMEAIVTMTMSRFGVTPDKIQQALGSVTKENVGQLMAMPPKRNQPPQQPGMIQGA
jgi:hypothetical protein